MGKQIHSQQGDQIRKGPTEFGPKLKETQHQHRNQCCPNLNLNGIGTGPYKRLDLEILFQGFKEGLYLPTVFVNGSNGRGPQGHVIGQKNQDLLVSRGHRPRSVEEDEDISRWPWVLSVQ